MKVESRRQNLNNTRLVIMQRRACRYFTQKTSTSTSSCFTLVPSYLPKLTIVVVNTIITTFPTAPTITIRANSSNPRKSEDTLFPPSEAKQKQKTKDDTHHNPRVSMQTHHRLPHRHPLHAARDPSRSQSSTLSRMHQLRRQSVGRQ